MIERLSNRDNLLQYILDNVATDADRDQLDRIIADNKQLSNQTIFDSSMTNAAKKKAYSQMKSNNDRGNNIRLQLLEKYFRSDFFDTQAVYNNALELIREAEKPSYKKEWLASISSLAETFEEMYGERNPFRKGYLEPAKFDNKEDFQISLYNIISNHLRLLELAGAKEYIKHLRDIIEQVTVAAYLEGEYLKLPNSPTSNSIHKILNTGLSGALELEDRNKLVNTSSNLKAIYTLETSGKWEYITPNGDKLDIVLSNIETKNGSNKSQRMLYDLFLVKANEQAIDSNGEYITREVATSDGRIVSIPIVTIDLKELVDLRICPTIRAARTLFYRSSQLLAGMKVSGTLFCGKRRKVFKDQTIRPLFLNLTLYDNKISFHLNEFLPREFYNPFITIIPKYVFSLSNNGYTLLRHIYIMGRQNADKISASNKFVLSIRDIQMILALKSDKKVNAAGRLVYDSNAIHNIKEPILKTIEEIETAQNDAHLNDISFLYTPADLETLPIKEFLKGKLEITFNAGEFGNKYFSSLPKRKKRKKIT